MTYTKLCALTAALAFLFSIAAFAGTKDQGKMQLTDPVEIGSTHLKPGNYKVEWNGTGNNVQVDIVQHGKTVATTSARLVEHQKPSPYDAVVTDKKMSKVARLDEIDFGNRTEALVLRPSTMAKK
ncbi:MAG TPA: hypothetical protein VLV49_09485 [Terriglobales bacterium]|nr:hypothetical protein [Terriglobales bacterium]